MGRTCSTLGEYEKSIRYQIFGDKSLGNTLLEISCHILKCVLQKQGVDCKRMFQNRAQLRDAVNTTTHLWVP
jgi:hypothetical protein